MRAEIALAVCLSLSACDTLDNFRTTLEMAVDGPVLRMDGIINSQALAQFEAVLDDNAQVQVIEFGEVDGSTDEVVVAEMGYLIRDRGFATRMTPTSKVFSGGVDLFLAGSDRRIAPGALVGVHEWESGKGRARAFPRGHYEHEPTRGYIEDMLGSDAFYWFTLDAAPPDEVHLMTRAELERFGVVTQ